MGAAAGGTARPPWEVLNDQEPPMSTTAYLCPPVKAIAPAAAMLDIAGTPHKLSLKLDAVGVSWRLIRLGSNISSLVYRIGTWGRPRRYRCTCPAALLARVGEDLEQGDDQCDHIDSLRAAGLLQVL